MADLTIRATSRAGFIADMKALTGLHKNPVYRDEGGIQRISNVFYWRDRLERCDIDGPYRYVKTPATYDADGNLVTAPVYAPGRYFNMRIPTRAFGRLLLRATDGVLPGGTVLVGATGLPRGVKYPSGKWGGPPVPQRVWL